MSRLDLVTNAKKNHIHLLSDKRSLYDEYSIFNLHSNFDFHPQVPDGHPGSVCGHGLQPCLLSPRPHIQVDQIAGNLYNCTFQLFILFLRNKPPLSWLWGFYKVLDRRFFIFTLYLIVDSGIQAIVFRYRKNLKSCFIVHPTNFIKVVYNFFKPIISVKFGRKIQ